MLLAARYGSDVIVDLLKGFGIQYAALNPGATYRGLHDSIVNYGGNCPEIVTCTHEEIAVAIAHGYTKVTGKPMAAIVHDVVGLLHSSMAIYYAHIDRVPMLVLGATGPLDRSKRRPYIDWIHSALVQGNAVRDFVKWDDQPASVADFAPSFARGYRIATTEPAGPVYLCYDAGLQEDELERPVSVKAEVEAALPTAAQADPAALADAADRTAPAARSSRSGLWSCARASGRRTSDSSSPWIFRSLRTLAWRCRRYARFSPSSNRRSGPSAVPASRSTTPGSAPTWKSRAGFIGTTL